MKCFSLIHKNDDVVPNKKVLSPEEFSAALEAKELILTTQKDMEAYKQQVEQECIALKESAKKEGFQEGLNQWSQKLAELQADAENMRSTVKEAIIPLAMASVKKIINKEIESHPDTIVSIIGTTLRQVTQNKKIVIYVNPSDLPTVEQSRPAIKQILEYADAIIISSKPDIEIGGCVVETETGIINAQLDAQLQALEKAFAKVLESKDLSQPNTPPQEEVDPNAQQNPNPEGSS